MNLNPVPRKFSLHMSSNARNYTSEKPRTHDGKSMSNNFSLQSSSPTCHMVAPVNHYTYEWLYLANKALVFDYILY